jgi:hypothetical protein
VQPLASRRVTYRSNRSNAPQNLLIFSHSGVASASASSGEQSLDAVDMSDAPSDQALAFPMGRRASFSRLWVPRTTAHPWRSSRARSGAPKRKGIDLVVFTRRAFDGECISDLYRRDEGPEGATLSDVNQAGRRSSGSSREASAVEPTRSQNMTVR